jgi:hypothetical protein
MKLEEWGIRKNTSSKGRGSRVPSRTSKKTSARSRPSTEAGSSSAALPRTAGGDLAR